MSELHITRGLPGSGKTTLAEAWVAESPDTRARVNRDSFRRMFHGHAGIHNQTTEPLITKLAHDAVRTYLRAGHDVIVDDTNLRQRTAREWATLAKVSGADLVVHDLTRVPLEECQRRNHFREHPIPNEVIEKMHAKYLAGGRTLDHPEPIDKATDEEWEPYEPVEGLPWAVIVDIDGTIAKCGDRDIYDGSKAHLDTPHADVIDAITAYSKWNDLDLIVMSGRSDEHREVTEHWLAKHFEPYAALHMRPSGDKRKDSIVKHELFNRHVRGRYNIAAAFDDRDQVVRLWRDMGIRTYQVADGNF